MGKPTPSPIRIEDDSIPKWLMVISAVVHFFVILLLLYGFAMSIFQ